jgi:holo-[acyl-carrier protein] synthase
MVASFPRIKFTIRNGKGMIVGIGTDIVDLVRFENLVAKKEYLLNRLFGPTEQLLSLNSLAGRFAAKEALFKAMNKVQSLSMAEIEVLTDSRGKPFFAMSGKLAEIMQGHTVHLTITHDAGVAVAFVIVEVLAE